MTPIVYDLCTGLHGWLEAFLEEGYRCVGVDIEDMCESLKIARPKGIEFMKRDILTIHGSEFRDAACIVASPPCTEYSYMAMPWKRAKQIARALRGQDEFPAGYKGSRTVEQLNALFNACFRIQREASEAAGRYIPMVVENVRGAQPWVGRAAWNFGSFYLWGDVPALMPMARSGAMKGCVGTVNGSGKHREQTAWDRGHKAGHPERSHRNGDVSTAHLTNPAEHGRKVSMNFHEHEKTGKPGRSFQSAAVEGLKIGGIEGYERDHPNAFGWAKPGTSSKGTARKAASAQIAKIPEPLARHIAQTFKPSARAIA